MYFFSGSYSEVCAQRWRVVLEPWFRLDFVYTCRNGVLVVVVIIAQSLFFVVSSFVFAQLVRFSLCNPAQSYVVLKPCPSGDLS